MITKEAVEKIMDALMLKHWGIFSINQTYREAMKKKSYFEVQNSILNFAPEDPEETRDKTVIAIAVPYALEGTVKPRMNNMAKVEAFGWDFDYHVQIKSLLHQIQSGMEALIDSPLNKVTLCVDTSPFNDREVGFYAGLGRVGYNHLLIHDQLGSNVFIGYLVFHQTLPIDPIALVKVEDLPEKIVHPHCETCSRCVKACPTQVCGEGTDDMTLCLSAQTQSIQPISEAMRHKVHDRLYGCSVCQIVCPLNQNQTAHALLTLHSENWLDALAILESTSREFKRLYGHMGFSWRPLWTYKRNALIILGNVGNADAYDALLKMGHLHGDERLSEYYSWAIAQLESRIK